MRSDGVAAGKRLWSTRRAGDLATPKGRYRIMFFLEMPATALRRVLSAVTLAALPLVAAGCMSGEKDLDLSTYVEQTEPADVLYNQGLANLNAGRLAEASAKFDAVDRQHPYS